MMDTIPYASTQDMTDSALPSVMVVDDDPDIRNLLADYLRGHGFNILTAEDGTEMFRHLEEETVNLIVLDIMMPGEDGLGLCRRLRSTGGQRAAIPVIFLTALSESTDRVVGLELGADDYVVKPFQPRELLARIRAVLRRTGGVGTREEDSQAYVFNGWKLDLTARHLLDPAGVIINLSGAEFRLLRLFLEHPQEVLSRDFIQAELQGKEIDRSPFDRSLDVQVCRLRSRLKDNGREAKLIKTVRGDGYVFTSTVSQE